MFDSDTIMITNNDLFIKAAERNYDLFKVPTNLVEAKKTTRYYTAKQKADLDIKTSVNKIGDIINLSQELQTYMWHQINHDASYKNIEDLFFDICQLYNETKKWLCSEINQLTINMDTLICIYRKLKKDENLKRYIITILFNIGNNQAFELIKESSSEIAYLIKDESGDIDIYGMRYSKKYKKPSF